jgi:hypothetical protein
MSHAVHTPFHAVQFYSEEKNLFETAATFLGQGFLEDRPAVIVATGRHTAGILDALRDRMIDIKRAERLGRLVVLDAERMIETVVAGDVPDPAKLEENVGAVVAALTKTCGPHVNVQLYGEGVNVLWKQGRYDAAIRLEVLWNVTSRRYPVTTLCGYAMRNFLNETMLFDEVCRQHSHVMPARTAH